MTSAKKMAAHHHDGNGQDNEKQHPTVYRLHAELQSLLWLFCNPLIPRDEKFVYEPLIISTIRKIVVLRGAI